MPAKTCVLGKAKAKSRAFAAVATTSEFSLKLRGGGTDPSHTDYGMVLEDALAVIYANPMFNNMVREPPRPISNTTTDAGFQHRVLA